MNFGQGLAFVFGESWAFWRRAWWLALVPTLPTVLQELLADRIPIASADLAYWAVVIAEALLTVAMGYAVIRFIALDHDMSEALTMDRAAARTFAPYLAFVTLFEVALRAWSDHHVSAGATLAQAIVTVLVIALIAPWSVTAPSGSTVIGPIRSATLVAPSLLWAVVFMAIAFVPVSLAGHVAGLLAGGVPDTEIGGHALSDLVSLAAYAVVLAFSLIMSWAAAFVVSHRAGVSIDKTRALVSHFE